MKCDLTFGIISRSKLPEYGSLSNNLETEEKNIRAALEEDVGLGDVTTNSVVPDDNVSEALIIAKEDTVIAGHCVAGKTFKLLDEDIRYETVISDGDIARKGETVSRVVGRTRAILTGERVALNFFQRLSGIATATKKFVDAVHGTGVVILDTRKTAPGLRTLEKYAVRMGGGQNHRLDLGEMALIKENHIAAAGSIREAVKRIRDRSGVAIEVEVKNVTELEEAIEENVDRIMLDNWNIDNTRKAVAIVHGRVLLEASGNMTIERAAEVARTGIDFISVGSITHSFASADLSLLIVERRGR
ncbi:MAG: Nicotinate-nucleotide pyrophosphorylase (carboxylating) [Syntrophorhabdus sp. PtaU1.Bin153]|nr:MAG: Nicotinate-nucleotide pyrophosphorylase (carboxylating) [Syntrophorhabdus sp. PtaU1.Bin153]